MRPNATFQCFIGLVVLGFGSLCYGLEMLHYGPVKDGDPKSYEQESWSFGVKGILMHESRVLSTWVNGYERFYFDANSDEILELIGFYSEVRLRDHTAHVVAEDGQVRPFGDPAVQFNVMLYIPAGPPHGAYQHGSTVDTYEAELTIYLGSSGYESLLSAIHLPENIILVNEINHSKLGGEMGEPVRSNWHAKVQISGVDSDSNSEDRTWTWVTYWERGVEGRIPLGFVDRNDRFSAPFSDDEIEKLKSGEAWLTLRTSKRRGRPSPDDTVLGIEHFTLNAVLIRPVVFEGN